MATKIVMPQASDSMEVGKIGRWLKKEGEPVKTGEVIVEVETDKATVEVEALGSGVLHKILAQEGEEVAVRKVIGIIAGEGETIDPSQWLGDEPPGGLVETGKGESTAQPPGDVPVLRPPAGRIRATPAARHAARQHGVDLAMTSGSGPSGRIRKQDVLDQVAQPLSTKTVATVEHDEVIERSAMRKTIGKSLQASKQHAPHFYVAMDIDMTACLRRRAEWNRSAAGKATLNDVIVKAVGLALQDVSQLNAVWQGDRVLRKRQIHIGVAVAAENGVMVPVVRDVANKTLMEVAQASVQVIAAAKEGKVIGQGQGTFTVSNMGKLGVREFTAIINPPECGILAVGAVEKRPVVVGDDHLAIRSMMTVTLSADHRVVDGMDAALFLRRLKGALEVPEEIFGREVLKETRS